MPRPIASAIKTEDSWEAAVAGREDVIEKLKDSSVAF